MTEDPAGTPFNRLSWRRIAEVSGLLGIFLYVCGWVFFAAFFAEFDVTPEEAGVNFQFVVVRVGIVLAIAFAMFLLLASVFRRTVGGLLASNSWSVPNTAFVILYLFLTLLFIGAAVLSLNAWRPWRELRAPINIVVAIVTLGLPAVLIVIGAGAVLRGIGYRWESRRVELASPIATFLLFAFVGAVVVGSLMVVAPRAAKTVREGGEFSLFGVRVDRVLVHPANLGDTVGLPVGSDDCMSLLGNDGSNFVLYSARMQETWIVNSQLVTLSRDLNAPCSQRTTR